MKNTLNKIIYYIANVLAIVAIVGAVLLIIGLVARFSWAVLNLLDKFGL